MKTLVLLRHCKAEENINSVKKDMDRKLTAKGISDAEMMGKRLFTMQIKTDRIISSHAERAKKTAQIVAEKMLFEKENIRFSNYLYGGSTDLLMKIVGKTDDAIQTLMLIGHNPAFNELLLNLCKTNIKNIPKGGVAGIDLRVKSWKKISAKCGTLLFFDSPKNK